MAYTIITTWDFRTATSATGRASRIGSYTLTEGGAPAWASTGVSLDATGDRLTLTLPAELKYANNFWIMCSLKRLGEPTDYGTYFGYNIDTSDGGSILALREWAGDVGVHQPGITESAAQRPSTSFGVFTLKKNDASPGRSTFADGVSVATTALETGTISGLYTGTSSLSFGGAVGTSTNANSEYAWAIIGTGDISEAEAVAIQASPNTYLYPAAEPNTYRGIKSLDTLTVGSTSVSTYVQLENTDGTPATGLTFATSGLSINYFRTDTGSMPIAPVTQTASGAWVAGGFVEVNSATAPGLYRLDLLNGVAATGAASVGLSIKGTGLKPYSAAVWLVPDRKVWATIGSSPSRYLIRLTGPTVGAGQLLRRQLQVITGAASNERVTIVDCAANGDVVLSPPLSVAPDVGDRVCIL